MQTKLFKRLYFLSLQLINAVLNKFVSRSESACSDASEASRFPRRPFRCTGSPTCLCAPPTRSPFSSHTILVHPLPRICLHPPSLTTALAFILACNLHLCVLPRWCELFCLCDLHVYALAVRYTLLLYALYRPYLFVLEQVAHSRALLPRHLGALRFEALRFLVSALPPPPASTPTTPSLYTRCTPSHKPTPTYPLPTP